MHLLTLFIFFYYQYYAEPPVRCYAPDFQSAKVELGSYLQSDFPDLLTRLTAEEREQLVAARANQAAAVFEQARLAGSDVLQAQEIAIAELTNGLSFSTYTVLNELLETEFLPAYQRLTQLGERLAFLPEICPLLEKLVQKYELDTGEN